MAACVIEDCGASAVSRGWCEKHYSRAENMRRAALVVDFGARLREQTHCKRGHEYTDENTYWRPDGKGRQCRKCIRIWGGW